MKKAAWLLPPLIVAAYLVEPLGDPDMWWHIVVGRWILAHHALPQVDYWNSFGQGKPWIAYSWPVEMLFAWVNDHLGNNGLYALTALFAAILCLSLCYIFSRIATDWYIGNALGIVIASSTVYHFNLRPQVFSWVAFAWVLFLSNEIALRGLSLRRAMLLAAVMCLWANCHITTIIGVAFSALWVMSPNDLRGSFSTALRASAVCLIGTLCTPYFGKEWIIFFTKADHPFHNLFIREFQPTTLYDVSTDIALLLLVLLFLLLHYAPRPKELIRIVAVALLTIGGFVVAKFQPFVAIALGALIARVWAEARGEQRVLGKIGQGIELSRRFFDPPSAKLIGSFAGIGVLTVLTTTVAIRREPYDWKLVPRFAVDFILEHQLPHPILNEFTDGGYLMYRTSNKQGELANLVPIDGRTNVNDPVLMAGYANLLGGTIKWRDTFEMVHPRTVLWPNRFSLVSILREVPEWCLVYSNHTEEDPRAGWSVFVDYQYWAERRGTLTSRNCEMKHANAG